MLVHEVFFWLRKDLSQSELEKFKEGIQSLEGVKSLTGFYVGKPAATSKRPSIDDSYDYALHTTFQDLEGHDAYQKDAIHLKFLEECKHMWTGVKVYDFD